MKKIFALTDYQDQFGSKWNAHPYRSGFDKKKLQNDFAKYGYDLEFIRIKDVGFRDNWENRNVIYTSSEEEGLRYKNFIEDIVLGIEKAGANVIPRFEYLRANNNKVYMEILRERLLGEKLSGNSSLYYGTLEELLLDVKQNKISYPCVIKGAAGAMSRGVFLANNVNELVDNARKLSRSPEYRVELLDEFRMRRHKGYAKRSRYQNKFIVQKYVPKLTNDWKVLVFGNHFYVLRRGIKKNDFRASGSHFDYRAGSASGITEPMLDAIKAIFDKLDVPHLSLDFAFDGKSNIIHEFQAVYFGTSTMDFSSDLFVFESGHWATMRKSMGVEEEYALGVMMYLAKHSQ